MSNETENTGDAGSQKARGIRKPLSPITVVIVLILAVVCIGFSYWWISAHTGPPPDPAYNRMIDDFAAKCHGDFKQLSPADQKAVLQMSQGHDPSAVLAQAYKHPL